MRNWIGLIGLLIWISGLGSDNAYSQSFFPDEAYPICEDSYVRIPPKASPYVFTSHCISISNPLAPGGCPPPTPPTLNDYSPYIDIFRVVVEEGSFFEFKVIPDGQVNLDFLTFLNPNWDDLMSTPIRRRRSSQNVPPLLQEDPEDLTDFLIGLSENAYHKCGFQCPVEETAGILRGYEVEPGDEILIIIDRLEPIEVNYDFLIGGDVVLDCSFIGYEYFKCIDSDETTGIFYEEEVLPDLENDYPNHTYKFFDDKLNAINNAGPEFNFPYSPTYESDYYPHPIYVRIENEFGLLIRVLTLDFYLGKNPVITTDYVDLGTICDNGYGVGRRSYNAFLSHFYEDADPNVKPIFYDGYENFQNGIPMENTENYPVTIDTDVYAELINTFTGCKSNGYVHLDETLEPSPRFDLSDYSYIALCTQPDAMAENGITSITVESGVPEEGYLFKWEYSGYVPLPETGPNLYIDEAGRYKLTVSNDFGIGCEWYEWSEVAYHDPPEFKIKQSKSPHTNLNGIQVFDITSYGVYVFKVDNGDWQSPGPNGILDFTAIKPGRHKVYAKELYGCGEMVQYINIIGYPDFFTPNGDGINDYWNVGLEDQPNAKVSVYDRYGTPLAQFSPIDQGWDGTYNGRNMPSTDYWFKLDYIDENDGYPTPAILKGHFTLKR